MSAVGIVHAFPVGAKVEAKQPMLDIWTSAIVMRHEPYRGRPGYYVSYPGATESWHCHGGWQPEQCLRYPAASEMAS